MKTSESLVAFNTALINLTKGLNPFLEFIRSSEFIFFLFFVFFFFFSSCSSSSPSSFLFLFQLGRLHQNESDYKNISSLQLRCVYNINST